MTDQEKLELKEKLKKVMVDHLTSVGYPDITDDQIMRELKPMWIKLEESGILADGMTFAGFQSYANEEFMKSQFRGILGI